MERGESDCIELELLVIKARGAGPSLPFHS